MASQKPWIRVAALMGTWKRFVCTGHRTYLVCVAAVAGSGGKLSMDRKGAWTDNSSIERFSHALKVERVYPKASDSVSEAKRWTRRTIDKVNDIGTQLANGGKTPNQFHSSIPAEALLLPSHVDQANRLFLKETCHPNLRQYTYHKFK